MERFLVELKHLIKESDDIITKGTAESEEWEMGFNSALNFVARKLYETNTITRGEWEQLKE